jgi:hypothetical protein
MNAELHNFFPGGVADRPTRRGLLRQHTILDPDLAKLLNRAADGQKGESASVER